MNKYQILLYYKYVDLEDPEKFMKDHKALCESLNLTGRILIATEGLNGTVEGLVEDTEKYAEILKSDPRFSDMHIKRSSGTGNAFPKLWIRVRDEIVASHLPGTEKQVDPREVTGKYIMPEELYAWIHSDKKFYIVDMRNDYETEVGYFENSIKAPFKNFRDLDSVLPILETLKDETIVTICTGGVRCEKASGFLLMHGFKDVYQLHGGIVSYMEKYPNEDFLGKLYVFDGRITMGFNTDDPKHKVVGKCSICAKPSDNYRDCVNIHCPHKRHYIACDKCDQKTQGYCQNCINSKFAQV
jgi:UPF0176 protein